LEYLSLYDRLTGIFNRAFFELELTRLDGSRDYPITILTADLDSLKLINDTMGHETGDSMLIACAQVLKKSLRTSDILARVGGDEFAAILPLTDKVTGEYIAHRIRQILAEYNLDKEELPMGISVGVATAVSAEKDLYDLFKRADDLMYRDKLHRGSSTRNAIVKRLLAALAEKDYVTEGHVKRLESMCLSIGEKLELTTTQLSDLAMLAQVHDLGKVSISDQILFKPGPLSDEEWETMRLHPEKGYRIAQATPNLVGIADLILKHHERWDGSGYPLGLKGLDIPVECRILSIADAFDAMTNQRPYNIPKTFNEALEELQNNADTQFDPQLVLVFLEFLGNRVEGSDIE